MLVQVVISNNNDQICVFPKVAPSHFQLPSTSLSSPSFFCPPSSVCAYRERSRGFAAVPVEPVPVRFLRAPSVAVRVCPQSRYQRLSRLAHVCSMASPPTHTTSLPIHGTPCTHSPSCVRRATLFAQSGAMRSLGCPWRASYKVQVGES